MITEKRKRILLIIFAFLGSNLISFMLDPYSAYWTTFLERPFWDVFFECIIYLFFCAIISESCLLLDRVFNKKMPWIVNPVKRLVFQSIVQIITVTAITIIIEFLLDYIWRKCTSASTPSDAMEFTRWVIATVLVAFMISTFNTGNYLIRNWKATALEAAEHKVKAAEHKRAAAEAELHALKLQLDPHFVFNNLSVLAELILEDQKLGYEYAENFSKVYRYLLINSKKKLIPLSEELKFLNAYMFLINKRLGDGVVFEISIEPLALNLKIPPLTLQLLIENALKHNRTTKDSPLYISIRSFGIHELLVANTLLPLVAKPESAGIGLSSIISNYALLSDKMPEIKQDEHSFAVKIPLIV